MYSTIPGGYVHGYCTYLCKNKMRSFCRKKWRKMIRVVVSGLWATFLTILSYSRGFRCYMPKSVEQISSILIFEESPVRRYDTDSPPGVVSRNRVKYVYRLLNLKIHRGTHIFGSNGLFGKFVQLGMPRPSFGHVSSGKWRKSARSCSKRNLTIVSNYVYFLFSWIIMTFLCDYTMEKKKKSIVPSIWLIFEWRLHGCVYSDVSEEYGILS